MNAEFKSPLAKVMTEFHKKVSAEMAKATVTKYLIVLHNFDDYLCDIGYVSGELPESLFAEWINRLQPISSRTIATYETDISRFMAFAQAYGVVSHLPPTIKQDHEYQPLIFSEQEMNTICSISDNLPSEKNQRLPWIHVEIPMILRLLYSCGLRLGETLSIRVGDIDFDGGVLTMLQTKWKKERYVPMSNDTADLIQKYCMALGVIGKPDYYVFPGKSFEDHLTNMNVYHRFVKILEQAGFDNTRSKKNERKYCLHSIRHTYVVYAIKHLRANGISIDDTFPYLSTYLGHSTLYETQKYMKFSPELFPEEISRFDNYAESVYSCRIFHLDDEVWE